MLAVGPIYMAISTAAPFNKLMILSQTNCLWVLVLDAHWTSWYHCLKDTSSLFRSGITTKGVNSGDTHPQSSCECAWGGDQHMHWIEGDLHSAAQSHNVPTHSSSEGHFPVIHVGYPATPRDPQTALGWPVWGCSPYPPSCLQVGQLPVPPIAGHHQGPRDPWWLVLSGAHCLSWACWGGVKYPPTYPGQAPEHQRGDWLLAVM